LSVDGLQKRFVGAEIVDVVAESEVLQDFQGVHAGPDPVVVVARGPGAGGVFDRCDAVGDPFGFLRPGQLVLALPAAPVRARLVAAAHNLGGDVGVAPHRVADHEGGHFDAVPIQ